MNHSTHSLLASRGWILVAALLSVRIVALAGPAAPMQAYQIVGAAPKGVAGKLREMYAGRPEIQISNSTTGQIIVHGPPVIQQEIARWLAAEGLTPPQGQVQAASLQRPTIGDAQKVLTHSRQLRNLSTKDLESTLTQAWGTALQTSHDSVGDVATFRFPQTSAGATSLVVDRRTSTATVTAPESVAPSWQRLLAILDSRPTSTVEQTQIIPLVKADPSAIRKAVSMLTQIFSADVRRKQHIGQFVSMLFQAEGGAQPAGGAQPPPAAPPAAGDIASQAISPGAASAASMEAIARINNVQIEILDDVIVVRGRKEDVDRVLQIIQQIELQSLQFRPEIEIYYLKHADSFAINDQITTVYNAAFSRQGLVTVVPLQRPNALLLIGRKENIPSLIELISKLDLPAPTDADFKIFQLVHMSSIDAERTVRTFFTTLPPQTTTQRPGLGTRAIVVADYRSNALLVQAAPRDMIEISRLIEQLDVAKATITHEIRIFKLRNAIAATLNTILEEAITAAQATIQATAAQGQAQATPARSTPPAVSLQFRAIGPQGEQILNSGIMANVRVTADAQGNTLLVAAPPEAMGLMAALIEELDRLPTSEAQIKVFSVRNGDATALAEMLQNLFGVAPAGAQGAQPGVGTPTGAGDSAIVPLRFSVDQRTNSIIASGNAGDLNVIYHILTRLDEGDIRQRQTAVYRLRNAPAQDVSNALSQLLQQQLTLIQIAPTLVTPVEQLERQVIVVPEVVTNSLIVSATSRYFSEISRIIETLDRRPPMVVMQVVLAEVTLSDNEQFGIEWGLQDSLMFDRSASATGNRFNFEGPGTVNLPNDASPTSLATRENVATQGLANFSLGRIDPTLGFGGLVLTASSESVSVLLRALEQSSRSQIISRPQIQTLDNLPAFVQVGSLVPRISGITATQTAVIPNVQDYPVGLILQVTPRTSPDGTIVMQVYAEKSSVGPLSTAVPIGTDDNGNPILSPQIPRTLAQTTVSARSGQTVILGGLITKDLEEQTRRVPYLGDIPVLGRLFRFDSVSNVRTELLIILTPYLVTSEDQIEWLNARETERMSWCVADVVNIHGPIQISGNPAFNAGPTPLIFPDLQPGAPAELPQGPVYGPESIPMSPFSAPYPTGPRPYEEEVNRQNGTGVAPLPRPSGPSYSPVPPQPGNFPPGPMPYQDTPISPPPVLVPPGPAAPPAPQPGLGSSRRTPDSILSPQSLRIEPAPVSPGAFAPPNIQPALPPIESGVRPAYFPLPIAPTEPPH